MKEISISKQVLNRMQTYPACTIFTVDDFIDLADEESIRTNLYRLAQDNKISRCINGYYTIPYKLTIVNEIAYPSTKNLAEKYAERHGWTILPVKETVLNYLGLSTQIPVETEFVSSGPYRELEYRGHMIRFKHTDQLTLLQIPYTNALVIQAIKDIGKNKMTPKQFQRLCTYCRNHIKDDLSSQKIKIPSWIRKILRKIEEENHGKSFTSQ